MMTVNNLLYFSLAVYGLGCALSQSLMSFGGTLFALANLYLFLVYFVRQHRIYSKLEKLGILSGFVWTIYIIALHFAKEDTPHFKQTLSSLPLYALPLFVFLVEPLKFTPSSKILGRILVLVSCAYLVTLGLGIFQFLTLNRAAFGFFGNPIYWAYSLFPAALFFFEAYRRELKLGAWTPKLSYLAAGICFLGIFLANIRMLAALSFLYLAYRKAWKPLLIMLVVLIGALIWNPEYQYKFLRTFTSEYDPSYSFRIVAWRHNWNLFLDNFWFGVGPERNFIDIAKMPELRGHWIPGFRIFAHDVYLQTLAESGFLGFLGFLTFYLCLFWRYPCLRLFLFLNSIAWITENVFNNSKALHPFLFYTIVIALLWKPRKLSTP